MDTMEYVKSLEFDSIKSNLKEYLASFAQRINILKEWLFKKDEFTIIENRLMMMNDSASTIHHSSMNLRGDLNALRHARFKECLNDMPAIQRAAFHMKTFENYSTKFICQDLEISEDLFWTLMNKSRKQLSKALDL